MKNNDTSFSRSIDNLVSAKFAGTLRFKSVIQSSALTGVEIFQVHLEVVVAIGSVVLTPFAQHVEERLHHEAFAIETAVLAGRDAELLARPSGRQQSRVGPAGSIHTCG